jgi:chromosomal replication initiation ATPase DnaA
VNVAAIVDALSIRDLLAVLDDVCRTRHVTREEICGRARTRAIVSARHEVWWRLRHHPQLAFSYEEIGRLFHRDHSTILMAVRAYQHAGANTPDEAVT